MARKKVKGKKKLRIDILKRFNPEDDAFGGSRGIVSKKYPSRVTRKLQTRREIEEDLFR